MSRITWVTILMLIATSAAEPLVFNAPLFASPYTSAAYINPTAGYVSPAARYISPASASVVAPLSPTLPAVPTVPAVPATVPTAVQTGVPFSSVSAYSYGSSYSVQDYFPTVVNANPSLAYSAAYSLPYAYAADYYYRR